MPLRKSFDSKAVVRSERHCGFCGKQYFSKGNRVRHEDKRCHYNPLNPNYWSLSKDEVASMAAKMAKSKKEKRKPTITTNLSDLTDPIILESVQQTRLSSQSQDMGVFEQLFTSLANEFPEPVVAGC